MTEPGDYELRAAWDFVKKIATMESDSIWREAIDTSPKDTIYQLIADAGDIIGQD